MAQPRKSSSSRRSPKRRSSSASEQPSAEDVRSQLLRVRDALSRSVMLPGDLVRETLEDAVRRGRMTRDDAEDLLQRLVAAGRRQSEEVLGDLEGLVDRGRRAPGVDRALRQVDRARRVAGIGQSFPITGYDDLTAAQIAERVDELTPAELRKVRDYERRNANRKTVLNAIEKKLG